VNIVAHVHNHPEKLLSILEDASSDCDDAYEVALTKLCKDLNYVAVPYEGEWNAVKYPWDILSLTERFLHELKAKSYQLSAGVEVHPTAVIEGGVILEEGVRVMAHETIQGPCYIGKGTIIGTSTLVRESIIGEHCVIGFGSEVARSNLHSSIWLHTTYLGDSVVGQNSAFGAGTVAANFRLDEGEISSMVQGERLNTKRVKLGAIIGSHVRSGINVSFGPGVKVGAETFINSAVFIDRDIPEKKYVKMVEGSLEVRENNTPTPGKRL
jgi:bifunctional UDP-N-acetylglucosamine pyrophosphorylase/glucosamine-1-phosphate N-acetyltransferase